MKRLMLVPVVALLLAATGARAQTSLAEGGIQVYVWGEVRSPGTYRVASTADVVELLSAAGGPSEKADLGRIRVVRGQTGKTLHVNLKRSMSRGEMFFLKAGDVVFVPASFWSGGWDRFRDVLALAGGIASLITFYLMVRTL